jgi:cytochrome b
VVGNEEARFATFLTSPKQALLHLSNNATKKPFPPLNMNTHTPSGGYSVLLMLSLLTLQVFTGLFSIELDGFSGGPFSDYIDYELSVLMRQWHGHIFTALSAAIGLHLMAVAYYQKVLKINIISKMR